MKGVIFGLFLVIAASSCNKEEAAPVMTKEQVNRKIDSLSAIRVREVEYRAKRELEYRLKIELKVSVDSILRVRDSINKATAANTVNAAPAPPVPPQAQ